MSSEMTDGERAPRSGREMALELQKPRAVNGEPHFRELEPSRQMAAGVGWAETGGTSARERA